MVVGQLIVGQLTDGETDFAHGANVLLAVRDHFRQERSVHIKRAVRLRDAQQADQLRATVVFTHPAADGAAYVLKRGGQAIRTRLCRGAIELFQLEVDAKKVPKNKPLEGGVVCADLAGVVAHAHGEMVTGLPRFHRLVIERIRHTNHVGAGVLRVVVNAR